MNSFYSRFNVLINLKNQLPAVNNWTCCLP